MAKSWADELEDKWLQVFDDGPQGGRGSREAVRGAIHEALDKAAEMAQCTPCQTLVEAGVKGFIEHAIRSLK